MVSEKISLLEIYSQFECYCIPVCIVQVAHLLYLQFVRISYRTAIIQCTVWSTAPLFLWFWVEFSARQGLSFALGFFFTFLPKFKSHSFVVIVFMGPLYTSVYPHSQIIRFLASRMLDACYLSNFAVYPS